jgi:hypothetical protein
MPITRAQQKLDYADTFKELGKAIFDEARYGIPALHDAGRVVAYRQDADGYRAVVVIDDTGEIIVDELSRARQSRIT